MHSVLAIILEKCKFSWRLLNFKNLNLYKNNICSLFYLVKHASDLALFHFAYNNQTQNSALRLCMNANLFTPITTLHQLANMDTAFNWSMILAKNFVNKAIHNNGLIQHEIEDYLKNKELHDGAYVTGRRPIAKPMNILIH